MWALLENIFKKPCLKFRPGFSNFSQEGPTDLRPLYCKSLKANSNDHMIGPV